MKGQDYETLRRKLFDDHEVQRIPREQREFLLGIDERLELGSKCADQLRRHRDYLEVLQPSMRRDLGGYSEDEHRVLDISHIKSVYELVFMAEANLGADVANILVQQDKSSQLDMGDRVKLLAYALTPFPNAR